MIGRLTGTIDAHGSSPILIDVHDVGYLVYVPEANLKDLVGTKTLYIHTHVREEALDLYGFLTPKDQLFFELLLSVSGIGPKTALTVIGKGADMVRRAVSQNDVDFFTHIPRLGKKNAQKIIIELKNKIGGLDDLDLSDSSNETEELTEVLKSMGFGRNEIQRVTDTLKQSNDTIDNKLRFALKMLGKAP